MRHASRIGRLGGLAVGLGIGAALAAMGTASADPAVTPSPFDPNGLSTRKFHAQELPPKTA